MSTGTQRLKYAQFARTVEAELKRFSDVNAGGIAEVLSRDMLPLGALSFTKVGVLAVPAPATGYIRVLGFTVPTGYDGVVWDISNNLAGGSTLIPSNQALYWQIRINGTPVRNYEKIIVELGTVQHPRSIYGVPLRENDLVEYMVNHESDPGLGGDTVCAMGGYFYPNSGSAN